ncbi:MAG: hypothetical protein WCG26_12295, partial [Chloroflexales bacterium]
MSILICNVGGRDLLCAALPKDLVGERAWAEAVLARYDELRPSLRLPIIGKALRYLADQGVTLEALVLIASDQPTGESRFWASDTAGTAALIARLIAEGAAGLPPVPAERISIWKIADGLGRGADPSAYDGVLAFFERQLPALAAAHPVGPAFLEVTGGTPAMTTGLLIAGTEAFGPRAEVLSIHPGRERPSVLGTGRRLLATPLRATLRSNAATYAYDAALRTFREQRATIADRLHPRAEAAVEALLAYASCRYSFDFPGARVALAALHAADTPWRADLDALAAQVAAPDRLALLAEVVHGAEARYATGLYADFLTQLVRFEENLLRLLCLERGVRFTSRQDSGDDDDGSLISRDWLREQAFSLKNDYDDGRDRANNRSLLRELVGLLTRTGGEDFGPLLTGIDRLRPLVYLRNDSTHNLDGVRRTDLADRFTGRRRVPVAEA